MIKTKLAVTLLSTALVTTVGGIAVLNFNNTQLNKTTSSVTSYVQSSENLVNRATTTINNLISEVTSLKLQNKSLNNEVNSDNEKIAELEKELNSSKSSNYSPNEAVFHVGLNTLNTGTALETTLKLKTNIKSWINYYQSIASNSSNSPEEIEAANQLINFYENRLSNYNQRISSNTAIINASKTKAEIPIFLQEAFNSFTIPTSFTEQLQPIANEVLGSDTIMMPLDRQLFNADNIVAEMKADIFEQNYWSYLANHPPVNWTSSQIATAQANSNNFARQVNELYPVLQTKLNVMYGELNQYGYSAKTKKDTNTKNSNTKKNPNEVAEKTTKINSSKDIKNNTTNNSDNNEKN